MKGIYKYLLTLTILITIAMPMRSQEMAPPTPGGGQIASHSYAATSVLNSGKWIKVQVAKSGLHKISFETLRKNGIDPQNAHIFGYGGGMLVQDFAKPKTDDLPEVTSYIYDNNLIFFAQGPVSWEWTGSRFHHTTNPYSQYGYYFITSDAGEGKRIEAEVTPLTTFAEEKDYFLDYQLHEIDSINLIDRSGKAGGGREFYGEVLGDNHTLKLRFSFPNLLTDKYMTLLTDVAALSTTQSTYTVTLNGQTVQTFPIAARREGDNLTMAITSSRLNSRITPNGETTQNLNIHYLANHSAALGFINYVELSGYRRLVMVDDVFYFSCVGDNNVSGNIQYTLSNATSETRIWNITNPINTFEVSTTLNGDKLSFIAPNSVQKYVAVNLSLAQLDEVNVIGAVANQNLHALEDIEYVVITNELFLKQAQDLAKAHETYDGLTVAVVTDQQVYNEFSSGTPDATAYRWLMKMLYDRALRSNSNYPPRYLQLMGDGTFDNRKLLRTSGNNFLLTYQAVNSTSETAAYSTDDYFCFLGDDDGTSDMTNTMKISVGRLPVNSVNDAEGIVNKLIRYMRNETFGNWKNQLLFLADDGDATTHVVCADTAAEIIRKNNKNFNINKIYLDAFQQETTASGESYPLAKNKLENQLTKGILFFNYCGHAGYTNITSESVLHVNDIRKMENAKQGFWLFATCNFSQYDAQAVSAGEESVLNPNGGAISMLSACRTVYASENDILNRYISEALFANSKNNPNYANTIGDAIRLGKNQQTYTENKLPYILLGDPALRLHYPTDYSVQTLRINGKSVNETDTLRALSINTIEGQITDPQGNLQASFNGKIQITIFDKMQIITTNDNDQYEESRKNRYKYRDYPNTLFNGEVDVVDGEWSCSFMIPKDIKYNFGAGRIVYYAYDAANEYEANGYFQDFIVGGSSAIEITDNQGPMLTLYMENKEFKDGSNVNERPHFYADIYDENGINTVGTGIGHDLLLTIDSDPNQTYIMNDYFTAEANSYQAGQISYRLSTLAEGQHHLSLRAWDLLNNSSTAVLNFGVVTGLDPVIFSITTYPNPVNIGGTVYIDISHDRPDAVLWSQIDLYDLSGRKITSYGQQGADQIKLNISQCNISAGIYVYQVRIRTEQSEYVSKNGKLIIAQ